LVETDPQAKEAPMIEWASNRWRSIWHAGLRPRSAAAALFAVACVGIATLVRIGLGLISPDSAVFAPYYSATLVTALVGGAEAAGLAAALGGVVVYCLFVPPEWNLASFRLEQLVSLVLYGTSCVVIIWAAESYRGLLQRLRNEEAMRRLLNLELVHRIKNMLTGVQSIVCQSLRGQEDLLETVSARLAALGATNDLLVTSGWRSASLRDILVREFAPYDLSRFRLRGDDVDCPYAIAILLALIVHELTTNAVKYGALSTASGRIGVDWSIAAGRLALEWVESGGPPPSAPTRSGFGSKLLRSGVSQFEGTVECRFEPDGLRCRFSLLMPQEPKRATAEATSRLPAFQRDGLLSSAETNMR
jgi:two-component sensor histidine kinase